MDDLTALILIGTVLTMFLVGLAILLLVRNHNRRIRHRAEMAEFKLARDREVMKAEREAQKQTLRDVGRELHDNLGQLLTLAQIGLDNVMAGPVSDPRMMDVMHTVELSIDEVRRMGRTLNGDLWTDRSFGEALAVECERIERVGLARVHLLVEEEPPHLPPDTKTVLYRIFQEVMNNALKHAQADTIEVALLHGDTYRLTITDNGKGFDPASATAGSGLVNIRHRCALIGFDAELTTAPWKGTRWHFTQRTGTDAA